MKDKEPTIIDINGWGYSTRKNGKLVEVGHIKDGKKIPDAFFMPDFNLTPASKNNYGMIKQDSTLNALARVSSKTGIEKQDFTTTGIITTKNGNTDLQVIIQEYGNITLSPSTSKLLRIITMEFTKNENEKLIKIPLKDYMELTGLKDIKDARKKVKADLEALYNVSVEAYRENRKGEKDYIKFRICDTQGIKNSVIFMNLSDSIANHLRQCELMPYPKELLKIQSNSQKNPYAFYLGDKIAELKKYNLWDKKTGKTRDSFNVAVKTLLKVCTDNGMPTYEEVQRTDRQVNARIIEPFIRDLTASSGDGKIFDFYFCNEKGVLLTDEQLSPVTAKGKYKAVSYKDWEAQYIHVTFKEDYPTATVNPKRLNKTSQKKSKK